MKGIFVTGTDSGVGKTLVGCGVVRALTRAGVEVAVRKPVESGCEKRADRLHPADGALLARAAGHREELDRVAPLRLAHAIPPDRAARLEGVDLRIEALQRAVAAGRAEDFRVVEGAGGFLAPLALDGVNADLAVALGLPVLVVVADRPGCINHALLTVEAVERRGLAVTAVVVNAVSPEAAGSTTSRDDLLARIEEPVVAFGHGRDDPAAAEAIVQRILEGTGSPAAVAGDAGAA